MQKNKKGLANNFDKTESALPQHHNENFSPLLKKQRKNKKTLLHKR